MEGITKERLIELIEDGIHSRVIADLLDECTELNPWLPIADAPKDRPSLLLSGATAIEGSWVSTRNLWIQHWSNDIIRPTHYQELPEAPT